MDRREALRRAVKEISDAQRAMRWAENRSGITDAELRNLKNRLDYARYVFGLIERDGNEKVL